MFQQNSLGRIYVRGKPTPQLTRARIIQLCVQGLSVSQISADVKLTKQGVSKTITAVAIEVFLECCINSFANMNQFI